MQADPIKSIIDIPAITSNTPSYPPKNSQPSPQIANSSIKKPQKQSEVTVNVAGSIKGSSFAGKRRINNAMYLWVDDNILTIFSNNFAIKNG